MSSDTARRENPTGIPITPADEKSGVLKERQRQYEEAKRTQPRCSCGARVTYLKAREPYPQCFRCESKTTDRILSGEERAPFDPDRSRARRSNTSTLPNLRRVREARGWGVKTLARYAGLNPNTTQRADDGEPVADGSARKLARALKVDVGELERGEG